MSSKAKGVVALILVVAVLANVGIFAKMSYNKTHTAQETIVFRVGDTVASDHPISQALYMFEEELERISNGRFDVRVYINSALGGDRQQTESVILGYMQGNTPPTSVLAGFDTRFMVVDLPFVFKSGEAAMKTLNGDLGKELDPILEGLGLHAMGWTESGYRHITTNNIEATSPEALKGLSIRTQENPIHMASFQAWGASPTPMAFSELFTALQQGAVDASVFHVSRIPATSSIHTKAFPDRFPDRSFWSQACSRFGGRRCFQIMLVSFFKGFRCLLFGFERFIFCSVLSVHLRFAFAPVVIYARSDTFPYYIIFVFCHCSLFNKSLSDFSFFR